MKLFGRLAGLAPPELRRRLDRHERVLAVADTTGSAALASQLGLWLPTSDAGWRRVGWDQIVKATWADGVLEVIEGVCDPDGVVADVPAERVALSQPRNLPVVVRQRVESSIARWEQIRVPGGTARLVARRVPGLDGLHWTARFDTGTADTSMARDVVLTRLGQIEADARRSESR